MKYCENCGSELLPNARFCGNCAAPVKGENIPETPEENTPEETVPEENAPEENASEEESGISKGTFAYGKSSNANEGADTAEEAPKRMPTPGTGDDGPHEYHYDQNSPYSCGTAGKGRHEGLVVKIVIIVVIIVVVLIVLFFLGINKARKNLEKIADSYNNQPKTTDVVEKEPVEEPPRETDVEDEPEEEDIFALDGEWVGQYTVQPAGAEEEEAYYGDWYDAYAYIGEDSTGKKYFEAYDDIESEDPAAILSMYIEETEEGFKGVFGDEDAWLYDKYLTEDDEYYYHVVVDEDNAIYLACPYYDEESGYDYVVLMYFEK